MNNFYKQTNTFELSNFFSFFKDPKLELEILIIPQKKTTQMQRTWMFWNRLFILYSRKMRHTLTLQFLKLLQLRHHILSVLFAYHYQKMTMITSMFIWLDGVQKWNMDHLHLHFKGLFLVFFHKGMYFLSVSVFQPVSIGMHRRFSSRWPCKHWSSYPQKIDKCKMTVISDVYFLVILQFSTVSMNILTWHFSPPKALQVIKMCNNVITCLPCWYDIFIVYQLGHVYFDDFSSRPQPRPRPPGRAYKIKSFLLFFYQPKLLFFENVKRQILNILQS